MKNNGHIAFIELQEKLITELKTSATKRILKLRIIIALLIMGCIVGLFASLDLSKQNEILRDSHTKQIKSLTKEYQRQATCHDIKHT